MDKVIIEWGNKNFYYIENIGDKFELKLNNQED